MLNRRILRIKAFKVLYGYAISAKMDLDEAMSELNSSCEATRDQYLWMLNIIPYLTAAARERIENAKSKFHPTEADLHPNEKFANNALCPILENDPDFQKLVDKKGLSWAQYDILVSSVLDSIKEKKYFQKYMASETSSLKEDCALFVRIFEEEFADNDRLAEIMEEKSIYWIEDLPYSLTYCCRSIEDIAAGEPWKLPELYQSDMVKKRNPSADVTSDKAFVQKLLKNAFVGYQDYFELVSKSVSGWDSDRLFSTDTTLIILGLAEAESFPDIPVNVTINEYVEISKFFSSPKSRSFVNGMLDKLIGVLADEGKIKKNVSLLSE